MVTSVKVPPDGGYGWVIVLANALSNVIIVPLWQTFGLVFKDTFVAIGLSATQGSLIINLNAAFGMIMGLLNGVLLKMFGYRKIAVAASLLVTVGIVLTSYANTFTHFMITYGLITSLGLGMNMSAYSLAVNTYFQKKKGKALGYALTITGLGPIFMPQLINLLIQMHTFQGVTLILGGIAANTLVAACLLQPVKWHLKTQIVEDTKLEPIQEDTPDSTENPSGNEIRRRKKSLSASRESLAEAENDPIYGMDSALNGSMMSLHSNIRRMSMISQSWKRGSVHLPKNLDTVDASTTVAKKSHWKHFFDRVVKFFDLDLLKDPTYINIMVGLSLAVFAEINFSLLTPFILAEFDLNTNQIATFLSVLGVADIIFRFLAPYICDFLKLSARQMYLVTLFLLMLTRFSLLISNDYTALLAVSFGLGVAKGVRTVYMSLVIPMYVPIEKLASAYGLQMMVNGFCILIGGPIIGLIRDVTGSYTLCIIILNFITFSTILIWTIEGIIRRLKTKKNPSGEPSEQMNALLNQT